MVLIKNLLVLALPISATTTGCFKGGEFGSYGKWLKEIDDVIKQERLEVACAMLAGDGKRKFKGHEERLFCMQEKDGLKWDFSLKYIRSGERSIDKNECMSGMKKQIYCKYGGRTDYYNWQYKADPNRGSCVG
ncbi:hypothetical protein CkaCkLH20_04189 [Colletotrichum karsti]|uniref:Uncharacterized protein n=1 Tax=Colletotrichum karsti TaxID=1095194 RepID=A0A9P6ICR5_9PEZI|nr:uncharacterized protein CkaCkLH20_04189 [Colletotrichum karsti]KAF9878151.1 hypothetical protein CkaCkLH20_04189 [Colletotrichum karsti]